jgi:hypothetical protein
MEKGTDVVASYLDRLRHILLLIVSFAHHHLSPVKNHWHATDDENPMLLDVLGK